MGKAKVDSREILLEMLELEEEYHDMTFDLTELNIAKSTLTHFENEVFGYIMDMTNDGDDPKMTEQLARYFHGMIPDFPYPEQLKQSGLVEMYGDEEEALKLIGFAIRDILTFHDGKLYRDHPGSYNKGVIRN